MKNIFKIALFSLMAVCLVGLVGCGKKEEEKKEEPVTQMPNPLVEVKSVEEMEEALGFTIPLLSGEVDKYIIINNEKGEAYHGRVIYKDGYEFEMEKSTEDVSGIEGGTKKDTLKIEKVKVNLNQMEDITYATWTYKDYSYSLSKKDVKRDALAKQVKVLIKAIKK